MSDFSQVQRECEKRNRVRRVQPGRVDHNTFFDNIRGDLLISGTRAADLTLLADMTEHFVRRGDLPTVLLTGRLPLFEELKRRAIPGAKLYYPGNPSYHPLCGLSHQQAERILRQAAEALGYTYITSKVAAYSFALEDIAGKRYPVSYQALYQLLREKDCHIGELAEEEGLPEEHADQILANREAGNAVRRLAEYLEETFQDISRNDGDTGETMLSEAKKGTPLAAIYQKSVNQQTFNMALAEELAQIERLGIRMRVIAEELSVAEEDDALLKKLLALKEKSQIELIVANRNALKLLPEQEADFANAVLFRHDTDEAFEKLSGAMFGEFPYHYAMKDAGTPPYLLVTLHHSKHWSPHDEQRLRVRPVDLTGRRGMLLTEPDKAAVYTGNGTVYLVPEPVFMKSCDTSVKERRIAHV